jgi:hypothetical protein
MLNIMKTYNLFGVLGGHGSLKIAIGDHNSLEVAHISFLCSFYYLIASSGIKAKVDCFLRQSPIYTITMSSQFFRNEKEEQGGKSCCQNSSRSKRNQANRWRRSGKELKAFLHHAPLQQANPCP